MNTQAMARTVYRAVMLCLWMTAGLLAIELFWRTHSFVQEHRAEGYVHDHAVVIPGMRPATVEEQQSQLDQKKPGPPVVVPPLRSGDIQHDTTTARFETLRALPDIHERHARATLDGQLWLLYDDDGEIMERFGDPYFERSFLVGADDFFSSSLDSYPILAGIMPDATLRGEQPSHPLWDYEIQRRPYNLAGGAVGSLYCLQLLRVHQTFEEIDAIANYEKSGGPSWIPQVNYQPNLKLGLCITDQMGFKNHPVAHPKPPRTVRIVCVGGSTMEDGDVNNPRTTAYLQDFFKGEFAGWRVEVINAGVCGNSSFEVRRMINRYLWYQPDLVIYYEAINDLLVQLAARKGGWSNLEKLVAASHSARRWWNDILCPTDEAYSDYWENGLGRNLHAIQVAFADAGVPMAVSGFAHPCAELLDARQRAYIEVNARQSWGSGYASYDSIARLLAVHNRKLRDYCSAHGVRYLPLDQHYRHGMSHFVDLCHFTPVGMQERARLFHEWLAPWLKEHIRELEAKHPSGKAGQ